MYKNFKNFKNNLKKSHRALLECGAWAGDGEGGLRLLVVW